MENIRLEARAKLNLCLQVDGRFENGYHSIRSLICPLELCDYVEIGIVDSQKGFYLGTVFSAPLVTQNNYLSETDPRIRSVLDDFDGRSNLVYRAADLIAQESSLIELDHLSVSIEKHIPFQAGLGGGSADAAAVLRGLKQFCGEDRDTEALLLRLAAQLGSDVPASLSERLIFVHGTGIELCELSPGDYSAFAEFLAGYHLLIIKPASGISTESAYKALAYDLGSAQTEQFSVAESGISLENTGLGLTKEMLKATRGERDLRAEQEVFDCFINHFEPKARNACEDIAKSFTYLARVGARHSILAGSGSAVAGFFESEEACENAKASLEKILPQAWFLASTRFYLGHR